MFKAEKVGRQYTLAGMMQKHGGGPWTQTGNLMRYELASVTQSSVHVCILPVSIF